MRNAARLTATVLAAMALLMGMATVASASSSRSTQPHTYAVPEHSGCGTLLAVVLKQEGTAVYRYQRCDRSVAGAATGKVRQYNAPEPAMRKGLGRLTAFVAQPYGTALYTYEHGSIRMSRRPAER